MATGHTGYSMYGSIVDPRNVRPRLRTRQVDEKCCLDRQRVLMESTTRVFRQASRVCSGRRMLAGDARKIESWLASQRPVIPPLIIHMSHFYTITTAIVRCILWVRKRHRYSASKSEQLATTRPRLHTTACNAFCMAWPPPRLMQQQATLGAKKANRVKIWMSSGDALSLIHI